MCWASSAILFSCLVHSKSFFVSTYFCPICCDHCSLQSEIVGELLTKLLCIFRGASFALAPNPSCAYSSDGSCASSSAAKQSQNTVACVSPGDLGAKFLPHATCWCDLFDIDLAIHDLHREGIVGERPASFIPLAMLTLVGCTRCLIPLDFTTFEGGLVDMSRPMYIPSPATMELEVQSAKNTHREARTAFESDLVVVPGANNASFASKVLCNGYTLGADPYPAAGVTYLCRHHGGDHHDLSRQLSVARFNKAQALLTIASMIHSIYIATVADEQHTSFTLQSNMLTTSLRQISQRVNHFPLSFSGFCHDYCVITTLALHWDPNLSRAVRPSMWPNGNDRGQLYPNLYLFKLN